MEIKPFKALRFNEAVAGDAGRCIAPPFDVIDPARQQELYEKSEFNIVRIIKGRTSPPDNASDNQYTRAAARMSRWIDKGALTQDPAEGLYAYVQDFKADGVELRRYSFIALGKLEPFGPVVRPHEATLAGPVVDRLKLYKATGAQFGLVFMLYQDHRNIAEAVIEKACVQQPLADCIDDDGVRHGLFAITSADQIQAIAIMMANKSCIIADGHHRYTTALAYLTESDNPAAGYQMCAFANACQQGLLILATHRALVNIAGFDFEKLITNIKKDFEVTEYKFDSAEAKGAALQKMLAANSRTYNCGRPAFGIYGGQKCFYSATLKDKKIMASAAAEMSCAWRSLDVAVLQKLVLEKLLGLDEEKLAKGNYLEYVKDGSEQIDTLIAAVDSGQKQAAFFTNPVRIAQLDAVTATGNKMPQKSTYFYPKVYTGLTINKL